MSAVFAVALNLSLAVLAASTARGAGPVVGWGLGAPPPTITATAIAAGGFHDCAIQAGSGAVVCWGRDGVGQATPPPSVDGSAGSAAAIATGSFHSCAIQAGTGAVVCWGGYNNGEATPPPSVDGTAGTASGIAAGGYHTLAIAVPKPTCGGCGCPASTVYEAQLPLLEILGLIAAPTYARRLWQRRRRSRRPRLTS